MPQKVFITGISGFVGNYLKKYLEAKHYAVFGMDRNAKTDIDKTIFSCDILDTTALSDIISSIAPDYVIHLAAQSSVPKSFSDPDLTFRVNVDGTRNLFNACLKKPLQKILVVSSVQIYGIPEYLPLDEKHPLRGTSPYAKSRIQQEKLLAEYKNLPITLLRSFNHTGPGQPPAFAIPSFAFQIAQIKKGLQPPILTVGNLDIIRDFSDVRDIVRAYHLALSSTANHEVYNVGSGHGYLLRDVVKQLIEISEMEISIHVEPSLVRSDDIPELVCNYEKFHNATGWRPTIPLQDTLQDVFHYFSYST